MSSTSYASYLMGHEENPYHLNHIREFQELSTMIAREVVEDYLNNRIEAIVNNAVAKAVNNAFSGAMNGIGLDVARIVSLTIEGLNKQFHSKEVDNFFADALAEEVRKSLSNIDVSLIIN